MKKYIVPLLLGIICGSLVAQFIVTPLLNKPPKDYTEYAFVTVGISVGEEGYYSTYADVALNYDEGSLVNIEVFDPTLLAFKHSEDWEGGYYVYSYEEIAKIIETLEQSEDPEILALIEALKHGLLMTEAST